MNQKTLYNSLTPIAPTSFKSLTSPRKLKTNKPSKKKKAQPLLNDQQLPASEVKEHYNENIIRTEGLKPFSEGYIQKYGRLMRYFIKQSDNGYHLVSLVIALTKQKWNVYIPTPECLLELFRLWRILKISINQNLVTKLFLESTILNFDGDIIVGARFDYKLFVHYCSADIMKLVTEAILKIQSLARGFMARIRVQRIKERIAFKKLSPSSPSKSTVLTYTQPPVESEELVSMKAKLNEVVEHVNLINQQMEQKYETDRKMSEEMILLLQHQHQMDKISMKQKFDDEKLDIVQQYKSEKNQLQFKIDSLIDKIKLYEDQLRKQDDLQDEYGDIPGGELNLDQLLARRRIIETGKEYVESKRRKKLTKMFVTKKLVMQYLIEQGMMYDEIISNLKTHYIKIIEDATLQHSTQLNSQATSFNLLMMQTEKNAQLRESLLENEKSALLSQIQSLETKISQMQMFSEIENRLNLLERATAVTEKEKALILSPSSNKNVADIESKRAIVVNKFRVRCARRKIIQAILAYNTLKKKRKSDALVAKRVNKALDAIEKTTSVLKLCEILDLAIELNNLEVAVRTLSRLFYILSNDMIEYNLDMQADGVRKLQNMISIRIAKLYLQFSENYDVATHLCELSSLVLSLGECGCDILGHSGACEGVAKCLSHHIDNIELCEKLLELVIKLTSNSVSNRLRFVSAEGCQTICQILSTYVQERTIILAVCRIIRSLCLESTDIRIKLGESGVGIEVVHAMKHYSKNVALLSNLCGSIISLCSNSNEVNCRLVGTRENADYFANTLKTYSRDLTMCKILCIMINSICSKFYDIVANFAGIGLPETLVAIISNSSVDNEFIKIVLALILTLCKVDSLVSELAGAGIANLLQSYETSESESVRKYAYKARRRIDPTSVSRPNSSANRRDEFSRPNSRVIQSRQFSLEEGLSAIDNRESAKIPSSPLVADSNLANLKETTGTDRNLNKNQHEVVTEVVSKEDRQVTFQQKQNVDELNQQHLQSTNLNETVIKVSNNENTFNILDVMTPARTNGALTPVKDSEVRFLNESNLSESDSQRNSPHKWIENADYKVLGENEKLVVLSDNFDSRESDIENAIPSHLMIAAHRITSSVCTYAYKKKRGQRELSRSNALLFAAGTTDDLNIILECLQTAYATDKTELLQKTLANVLIRLDQNKLNPFNMYEAFIVEQFRLILNIADSFSKDSQIVLQILSIFHIVCANKAVLETLNKSGISGVLSKILGSYTQNREIALAVLQVCISLTAGFPESRKEICTETFCQNMALLLQYFISDLKVIEKCSLMIVNLCSGTPMNQTIIAESGLTNEIISSLRRHCTNGELTGMLSCALLSLTNKSAKNHEILGSKDRLLVIIEALRNQKTNPKVFKMLCMMILAICTGQQQYSINLVDSPLPGLLSDILQNKDAKYHDMVQSTSVLVVRHLSVIPLMKKEFQNVNMVETLQSVLQISKDPGVHNLASMAIKILSE